MTLPGEQGGPRLALGRVVAVLVAALLLAGLHRRMSRDRRAAEAQAGAAALSALAEERTRLERTIASAQRREAELRARLAQTTTAAEAARRRLTVPLLRDGGAPAASGTPLRWLRSEDGGPPSACECPPGGAELPCVCF